ncbi:MAG TPA: iron-sulfur cluster biosynthesis family protein [Bacillus sp. (in: firmicutes)]|uniref:iron-sulfur cluster biosynthesis family protein n=1 Tax=Bacillus litorisediminis TaxID=2922713 RepID=UPI001FAE48EF|nr:iron-sulfur cluster biosynthesis family protein [Bacillus litorisediminis]HWO75762.1 iron-sulfur cluster biosynthesis family protein [Bacillus sp. (in: firmicutes)]
MFITITEKASTEIEKKLKTKESVLRLHYDTEGCGCAVSGVPTLYLEQTSKPGDHQAESNAKVRIFYNPQHQIFLGDRLTIDFSEKANTFQLKTPNEMLSPRMKLIER